MSRYKRTHCTLYYALNEINFTRREPDPLHCTPDKLNTTRPEPEPRNYSCLNQTPTQLCAVYPGSDLWDILAPCTLATTRGNALRLGMAYCRTSPLPDILDRHFRHFGPRLRRGLPDRPGPSSWTPETSTQDSDQHDRPRDVPCTPRATRRNAGARA